MCILVTQQRAVGCAVCVQCQTLLTPNSELAICAALWSPIVLELDLSSLTWGTRMHVCSAGAAGSRSMASPVQYKPLGQACVHTQWQ